MIGLVDGDIVVFRCGFASERNIWHVAWDKDGPTSTWNETQTFQYKRDAVEHLDKVCPGKFSRVEGEDYDLWPEKQLEPLEYALQSVKTLLQKIGDATDLDPKFDMKILLSSGRNYRHDIATTRPYKGNRKVEHRPTYEQDIKKYLRENYDCEVAEHEEADDLMGIYQTKYGPEDSIIITLDKDLDQVPGLKYNWVNDVRYSITEAQARYNFYLQLLMGDTTDNIPGLPGIGAGKAAKALHSAETEEDLIAECIRMYQIHSGKEDWKTYMLEQGQLLWIRREVGELWDIPPQNYPEVEDWGDVDLTLEVS